jgi:integrase/recombinase XerD
MKSFNYYSTLFLEHLQNRNIDRRTIQQNARYLTRLFDYLQRNSLYDVREVSPAELISFFEHIRTAQSPLTKRAYSSAYIYVCMGVIKRFFLFLSTRDLLLANPFEKTGIEVKYTDKRRDVFTCDEINTFLDSINIDGKDGLRNRAFFELVYSCGLRRNEALDLKLNDLDFKDRMILVREGKGGKDRVVPFSKTASFYLRKYITQMRESYFHSVSETCRDYLFLTGRGRLSTTSIQRIFTTYIQKLKFCDKKLTIHSIRHSTATHLLEAGADVRYVQELLGHESIETTVRYTHTLIEKMRLVYKSFHPRENQYFREVDEEYLKALEDLKAHIVRARHKRGLC